ncbi:DNA polymerase Y family protein [Humibacter sp. BT305]|nr:DNA polymerase Y family protein [Humibacter sp. BT305]
MSGGRRASAAAPGVAVPMRTMVVWCPDWPVTAMAGVAGVDPAHPIAVIEKDLVHACSATARAEGVRRGLRVREAQARCPQLVVLELDQVRVDRAFEPLIAALEDLSPGVQVVRSGVCALRSRGPARYYGSERRAAAAFLERLAGLGAPDARVGVSDGLFAADIAARLPGARSEAGGPGAVRASHEAEGDAATRIRVVPAGEAGAFLAGLPVQFTGDDELVGLLVRLGVRTLGDFAAIPAEDVRARFGEVGARAHLRASGSEGTAVVPRVPPELREVVSEFEPPLDRVDQITFGIRAASDRFVDDLREARLVCTAVRIELTAETGRMRERVWLHPRWFTASDVVDRVRWQLQGGGTIDDGLEAPVARVRIAAEAVDASIHHETGLWGTGSDERVHHALSRVQSMVGHEGVLTAVIGGGRGLAERQRLTPWGDRPDAMGGVQVGRSAAASGAGERTPQLLPARPTGATAGAERTPPWPGSLPPPVPTTVFAQLMPVLVEDAAGDTVDVTDRGEATAHPALFSPGTARSELRPVAAWAGPWPVSERWWDAEGRRSYARFQVVDADGDAWLLRVEQGRWSAEARYD